LVFKRRTPRTYFEFVTESFYPKGGWRRATRYVAYRLRRLPDPAHKISRGIAAGVFVSFTPLFGFHFVAAAAIAWALRGNLVASLLGTFFGNPLTFPLIAAVSMELGSYLLGQQGYPLHLVLSAFQDAGEDLWWNMIAIFTDRTAHWDGLGRFFDRVFLPYLVGGLLPGFGCAIASYLLANPLIAAYQKARVARMKKRFAKKRERAISRRIEAEKAEVISKRTAVAE
jgi:uncharacterized protein (DUF2062 family)